MKADSELDPTVPAGEGEAHSCVHWERVSFVYELVEGFLPL